MMFCWFFIIYLDRPLLLGTEGGVIYKGCRGDPMEDRRIYVQIAFYKQKESAEGVLA
jgi:hypothetical protein